MYVCMYVTVCMYVCMRVRTCVCMHACMHACMHVCVCMYVCTYVRKPLSARSGARVVRAQICGLGSLRMLVGKREVVQHAAGRAAAGALGEAMGTW